MWVRISNIGNHLDKQVTLKGWLYNKRSSGKIHFLQLRDGSGIIQCVMGKNDVSHELFEQTHKIGQESSIEVTGSVRKDTRSPLGYELGVADLKVISPAEDYPISPKEHGVAFLMDHRHLWLRSSRQHAILRIRDEIIRAIRDFFHKQGFILLDAPMFTPNACEGTTTLFDTEYFGKKAYLSQSGQLYMEAGAMAFGKVYCFGPTFRAEKSKTRRHLTEFWMVEPEMAYYELDQIMDLAEECLVSLVQQVLKNRYQDLESLERDISKLENIKKPFPRISYDQAIEHLKSKGNNTPWGEDFGGDEETLLSQGYEQPLMIHRYPKAMKAFYMKEDPQNPKLALGVDVIGPEGYGELIGGGQREDSLKKLQAAIKTHGLDEKLFQWYLDLRRYGSVPHGGFGLGLERTVAWICGLHHVRESIPFPRLMDRLNP